MRRGSWCNISIPQTYEEASKLFAAILLGIIYHYTPLRGWTNQSFFDQVNKRISTRLTAPYSESVPNALQLDWSKVRLIHYHFIDNEASLKVKSQIIRWNGLYWTSAADLRAICVIAFFLFSIVLVCDYKNLYKEFDAERAGVPLLAITLLFLASFFASKSLTRRHMELCDEQCDYILLHKGPELKELLKKTVSQ